MADAEEDGEVDHTTAITQDQVGEEEAVVVAEDQVVPDVIQEVIVKIPVMMDGKSPTQ